MPSYGVDFESFIRSHAQAGTATVANMPIFGTPALMLRLGVGLFNEKVAYDDAESQRLWCHSTTTVSLVSYDDDDYE